MFSISLYVREPRTYFSAVAERRSVLLRETTTRIYCESRTEHVNELSGKNDEILKQGYIHYLGPGVA
jgi:hypothetical protein